MNDSVVRLQEVEINNFKNVEKGVVCFQNYNNTKKNFNSKSADILGIYGQNGSGKTALVDVLDILKNVMIGIEVPKVNSKLLTYSKKTTTLKFVFLIEHIGIKYLVYYDFEMRKNDKDDTLQISKEILKYKKWETNRWKSVRKIIEYNVDDKDTIFKPVRIYNEIVNSKNDNLINLSVAKALSKRGSTSFIFSKETREIFQNNLDINKDYITIINSLNYFAQMNLVVIKNEHLGTINMNQLIPFSFRLESDKRIMSGNISVKLFEPSVIALNMYEVLRKIIKQINLVISSIIPGLTIDIMKHGEQLLENGAAGVNIEIISIRGKTKIPLKYESEGIKKIISILSTMIAMYNNKTMCLVVDELDAGVFEYLLGEILNILQENAKGQFIFTSHNLRVLEKLNKESIIFTTTNPVNRYIQLSSVKSNNNLRDFYLRSISLGGQKECLYDETNSYEIGYAFRMAGRKVDED